jgi:ABC-2 type transport system ATP-binding protein
VRAATAIAGVSGVAGVAANNGTLRVNLTQDAPVDREIVTQLLRRLLDDQIQVERVAPVSRSLEDQFLTMTTRLEDRS